MGRYIETITPYRHLDIDESAEVASAVPCKVKALHVFNANAAIRYLKLYNKATAADQNDTPIYTFGVPASNGFVVNLDKCELPFATGLSIRATTGIADNDTGAPSANDISINLQLTEYYAD